MRYRRLILWGGIAAFLGVVLWSVLAFLVLTGRAPSGSGRGILARATTERGVASGRGASS